MAGHRIALVIGNGAYTHSPLSNPPNDAVLMVKTLKKLDFEVVGYKNVNQKGMKSLIRDFGRRIKEEKDSVGVFYYSGHGMQVGGSNYMIPVDAIIDDESDITIEGVNINEVLTRMSVAENIMNFVFLDACRDNPFEKSFKSLFKGLGRIETPKGTLVAFAAQPNQVARQGPGSYSYFTEALAEEITKPNLYARDMLLNVRIAVYEKTERKQLPVVEDQMLGKFYFNPKSDQIPNSNIAMMGGSNDFESEVIMVVDSYGPVLLYGTFYSLQDCEWYVKGLKKNNYECKWVKNKAWCFSERSKKYGKTWECAMNYDRCKSVLIGHNEKNKYLNRKFSNFPSMLTNIEDKCIDIPVRKATDLIRERYLKGGVEGTLVK